METGKKMMFKELSFNKKNNGHLDNAFHAKVKGGFR
jgi:hypothetical protein